MNLPSGLKNYNLHFFDERYLLKGTSAGDQTVSTLTTFADGIVTTSIIADTATITSFTITSGLFGNGTALLPSISFTSDPNTGFYRYAADTLGFTAAGASVGNWSATALTLAGDLRVDGGDIGRSDDTDLLRFPAVGRAQINGALGLKTNPTNSLLDMFENTTSCIAKMLTYRPDLAHNSTISLLKANGAGTGNGDYLGSIIWYGEQASTASSEAGFITVIQTGAAGATAPAYMDIGLSAVSATGMVRLSGTKVDVFSSLYVDTTTLIVDATNDGVGINVTPLYPLHISAGATSPAVYVTGTATTRLQLDSTAAVANRDTELNFLENGVVFHTIGCDDTDDYLRFGTTAMGTNTSIIIDGTNRSVSVGQNWHDTTATVKFDVINLNANTGACFTTFDATTATIQPYFQFRRSNSNVLGTIAATTTGQAYGTMNWVGVNSASAWATGAAFVAVQNGAATANASMPTIFKCFVSDGTSLNEFWRITGENATPTTKMIIGGTNLTTGNMSVTTCQADVLQIVHRPLAGDTGVRNVLWLSGGRTAVGSGVGVVFNNYYNDGVSYPTWIMGRIYATYTVAANYGCDMVFETNSGAAVGSNTQAMRITSAGKMGIGSGWVNVSNLPAELLEVEDADATETCIQISNTSTGDCLLNFALTGTVTQCIGLNNSYTNMANALCIANTIANIESAPTVVINTVNREVIIGNAGDWRNSGIQLSVVNTSAGSSLDIESFSDTATHASILDLTRSRGTVLGTYSATALNDAIGKITVAGVNNAPAWYNMGGIIFEQDSTNAAHIALRQIFKCASSGGGPAEIMRIDSAGVKIANGAALYNNSLQVVGARQAHIINADGSLADITTKFNTLLSYLETHGLLAAA